MTVSSFGLSADQRNAERILDALLAATAGTPAIPPKDNSVRTQVRLQAASKDQVMDAYILLGLSIAIATNKQPQIDCQNYYPPSGGAYKHGTAHVSLEMRNHTAGTLHDLLQSNQESIRHTIRRNPVIPEYLHSTVVTRKAQETLEFPGTRSR